MPVIFPHFSLLLHLQRNRLY